MKKPHCSFGYLLILAAILSYPASLGLTDSGKQPHNCHQILMQILLYSDGHNAFVCHIFQDFKPVRRARTQMQRTLN